MSDNDNPNPPSSSSSPPPSTTSPSTLPQPPSRTPPSFPAREDCWTEEATHTLVQAWGTHYLHLNRGNLRQQHWQQVADAVNALHALTKKQHRTDIQCKNRIDTLKKRYKIEKSQTHFGNSNYVSTWPFFNGLDSLIGETFLKNCLSVSSPEISPAPAVTPVEGGRRSFPAVTPVEGGRRILPAMEGGRRSSPEVVAAAEGSRRRSRELVVATPVWKSSPALPPIPVAVPVGPRSKRPVSVAVVEEGLSRRNFSAMAAAAARAEDEDDEEDEEEDEGSDMSGPGYPRGRGRESREDLVVADGYRRLAEAIGRFAEVYQRVEESKQRQVVELEKQRMQFTKELEIQRMKLFMESQVHLERMKRVKRNSRNGE